MLIFGIAFTNSLLSDYMNLLIINNFLTIKSASIQLRRVNIFIGPQAQGKSVITKLITFFKEVPHLVFEAGMEGRTKREFDVELRAKFEAMFPRYAWEKSDFAVIFFSDLISVNIECAAGKLSISYSDEIVKALTAARKTYRKVIVDNDTSRFRVNVIREVRNAVITSVFLDPDSKIETVTYIPAGRSFFANLHKNVFSFLSSNVPIDYFIKEFGAIYERTRDLVGGNSSLPGSVPKVVNKLVEDLICGKHVIEKGQDWIIGKCGKISVSNSSSGQQEVLPMAVILSSWPYVQLRQVYRSYVIEEPEAHLFPVAQGQIVSLIATAYNQGEELANYIVTTHSPYILTAFNNLIQAHNVALSHDFDKATLGSLINVVPREHFVNFDDVSAYLVEDGSVRNILNDELRLIDASAIDSISGVFAEKFELLVGMEKGMEVDVGVEG